MEEILGSFQIDPLGIGVGGSVSAGQPITLGPTKLSITGPTGPKVGQEYLLTRLNLPIVSTVAVANASDPLFAIGTSTLMVEISSPRGIEYSTTFDYVFPMRYFWDGIVGFWANSFLLSGDFVNPIPIYGNNIDLSIYLHTINFNGKSMTYNFYVGKTMIPSGGSILVIDHPGTVTFKQESAQ